MRRPFCVRPGIAHGSPFTADDVPFTDSSRRSGGTFVEGVWYLPAIAVAGIGALRAVRRRPERYDGDGERGRCVELERLVIAGFVVVGALFTAVALGTSWLLSPKKSTPEKSLPYECGVDAVGSSWIRFRSGYYVFALLYVIFDIETVFLYPWAVTFGRSAAGWFIFFEMFIFIAILVGGLAYAWKEGALSWR